MEFASDPRPLLGHSRARFGLALELETGSALLCLASLLPLGGEDEAG
jgi:hypothetical protein